MVMNRVLAILLAFAVAAVPLVGQQATGCCCATGTNDAQTESISEAPGDSCCAADRAEIGSTVSATPSEPCDDQQNGPCDGCPKSCCTMAKVLAAPGLAGGLAFVRLAGEGLRGLPSGSAGSPHLDEMKRPPRPSTTA